MDPQGCANQELTTNTIENGANAERFSRYDRNFMKKWQLNESRSSKFAFHYNFHRISILLGNSISTDISTTGEPISSRISFLRYPRISLILESFPSLAHTRLRLKCLEFFQATL